MAVDYLLTYFGRIQLMQSRAALDRCLGIETTGRQKAIGTVEEVIEIVSLVDDPRVIPVIDWAHVYARNRGQTPNTSADFEGVLKWIETKLGYKPHHFHGGGVEHKNGNEIRHISARMHAPPLCNLLMAMSNMNYNDFTLIIESPTSIEDVEWIKGKWHNLEKTIDNDYKI